MHKKKTKVALITIILMGFINLYFFKEIPYRELDRVKNKQKRSLVLGTPSFTSPSSQSILKQHVEKQWALQDISILKAWEQTKGEKDIVVAIIDTGVHVLHPCLKNSLWVNKKEIPNNKIDDDNNGFVDDIHGWNFVNDNNNIQDRHGHGTHIAGLVAATGSNSQNKNCQVIGVAPNVSIMILKYYDNFNNNNNVENTIKSIEYAINNGAHFINYSGGGPGANEKEKALIAKAADKNIIFVAASGNDSVEIGKKVKYYPASYELPNILYVQSKNQQNEIIDSSNWIKTNYTEDRIYQTAPGDKIISTLPPKRYLQSHFLKKLWRSLSASEPTSSHNNYGYMTGTSQATAVATGVAALVKSRYPNWGMSQIIKQVYKTGFGQNTDKIKEKTNEGKKLNAYEALIMRDHNIDFSDLPNNSRIIMPATDQPSTLKNIKHSRGRVDVYDPSNQQGGGSLEILNNLGKSLSEKK